MSATVQYLSKIQGFPGRFNNIIHVPGTRKNPQNDTRWPVVCYFGGDIQNFRQEMLKVPGSQEYIEDYCLETIALKLSSTFPVADILVIQPSTVFGSFSCFENFVKSIDRWGTPRFDEQDRTCYEHLNGLLTNVWKRIFDVEKNPIEIHATLVAFSKGQIVLNQLARSLNIKSEEPKRLTFPELYFLDGGHNGKSDVWITQPELVDALIQNGGVRKIRVGVTDFQLEKSKWKADEERKFCQFFSNRTDIDFKRIHLRQNDHPDLNPIQLHFKILDYLFKGRFGRD